MHSTPRFLQGIFPFEGQGVDKPAPLHEALTYTVPMGVTTQPLYFRGGNSTDELITVVLVRDGAPMRYFPIGARDAVHVALAVVEDLDDDTVLELHVAAREGLTRDGRGRPGARGGLGDGDPEKAAPRRHRQRHGRRARRRGDPRARRRRAVPDHDVRRRAVRQLQPDHAQPRAGGRRTPRPRSTSTRWTGTRTTTSRCTPASASCASTGSRRRSTATTARSSRTTS